MVKITAISKRIAPAQKDQPEQVREAGASRANCGDSPQPESAAGRKPDSPELVRYFKLLADETRFRVLSILARETEMHVRGLCQRLGQSQPAVSHHLALLREAGLVSRRREGKHNYYRLVPDRCRAIGESWLRAFGGP